MINGYKKKDRNKDFAAKTEKFRGNPGAQQAINEISITSQIQNMIAYANAFVMRTGKFSLHYDTEDELEREKRAKRELQEWLSHLEEIQSSGGGGVCRS